MIAHAAMPVEELLLPVLFGITRDCRTPCASSGAPLDGLWTMWQWLDRAPLGRNEGDLSWFHRHDEYPATSNGPS
jgi:hypothetical protein